MDVLPGIRLAAPHQRRSDVKVVGHLTARTQARPLKAAALAMAWLVPAVICVALGGFVALDPFAGTVVGLAGVAYLATSLLIMLGLILLGRLRHRSARPTVALLVTAWTGAWAAGILTFSLVGILLTALGNSGGVPSEGFSLSPAFWLLSFPVFLVFLLSGFFLSDRRQMSNEARD